MSLASALKGASVIPQGPQGPHQPVWAGPESNAVNGGITFSLLSLFLVCRERFRLYVVDGLRAADGFNHRLEYGNMWHACEEALAGGKLWFTALTDYTKKLFARYKTSGEQIDKWYQVCKVQFEVYAEYWKKHPDNTARTPLFQEEKFAIPYRLPTGRIVYLRGKMDAVDIIGKGNGAAVYLQENKTKGDVDEQKVQRQLRFDLQTMMYLTALHQWQEAIVKRGAQFNSTKENTLGKYVIAGVRYNVVRRPLSGGKGSIVQHKPTKSNPAGETKSSYYKRLQGIIKESSSDFFMRWKSEVPAADVRRFREKCLDPILENLCLWHDVVVKGDFRAAGPHTIKAMIHWQHPFGVRNVLNDGGYTDLDEYLETGSEVGLERVDNLFPELAD